MPRQIDWVAVYFARHGLLHSFAIDSVVNEKKFPAFLRWFKQGAMNGPPRQRLQWSDGTTVLF